jgi:hypothetical protein
MTTALRWRIIALQGVLVIVLGFITGFAFWGANFAQTTVHDQLASQQITFPAASVLAAKEYDGVAEIRNFAGQQVVNGDQARVYANDFLGVHLNAMTPYNTYAGASTALQTMKKTDPNYTTISNLRQTLFMGTMLRTSLLNAYGWWTVGVYAFYAAIGLLIATIVIFGALLFELAQLRKPALDKVVVTKPVYAS